MNEWKKSFSIWIKQTLSKDYNIVSIVSLVTIKLAINDDPENERDEKSEDDGDKCIGFRFCSASSIMLQLCFS